MDKQKIIDQLLTKVNEELNNAQDALKKTKDFSAQEDMKAESKWDTRSTEAKFLASGQLQRVEELKQDIKLLEDIDLEVANKDKTISIGSVAEIEFNKVKRTYFFSPTGGGTQLVVNAIPILVISVFSPIASGAISLSSGDEFEVETPKENRVYKVVKVL